jgi:hypothetical protein
MIIRTYSGNLIEIRRENYKLDKEYYLAIKMAVKKNNKEKTQHNNDISQRIHSLIKKQLCM